MKDQGIQLKKAQIKLIRDKRTGLGWSQTKLAHEIGCTSPAISQFESAKKSVSFRLLNKICKAVGLKCEVVLRQK